LSDIKELRRAARHAHHRGIGWPQFYRENSASLVAVPTDEIRKLLGIVASGDTFPRELPDGYTRPLDFELDQLTFSQIGE
jgi:hypothetical protein